MGKNFVELRSTRQPRAALQTRAGAHERDPRAYMRRCRTITIASMSVENHARYGVASDLSVDTIATLAGRPLVSNHGIPLNLDWVQQVRVNTSAVERRAQSHVARRSVKKDWQAAWLLRAVSCMDLTTLSGDDPEERVRRLCAKARHPVQDDLVKRLGIEELNSTVAAVCV